jgi:hypothetical protein
MGGRICKTRQRRPIRVLEGKIIRALDWEDIERKELSSWNKIACLFALKWAKEALPRAKGKLREQELVSSLPIGLVRYALWHHKQLSVKEICSVLKADKWEASQGEVGSRTITSILDVVAYLPLPVEKVRLDELFHAAMERDFRKQQIADWKALRAWTLKEAGFSEDDVSPKAETANPGTSNQSDTESEGISSGADAADLPSRSPRKVPSIPKIGVKDGLKFGRALAPLREPISTPKGRRSSLPRTAPGFKTFRVLPEASDQAEADKEPRTRTLIRKVVSEQRPND